MKKEILYDGYLYDVTEWISRHPGGNIIKFYTENDEDSTDAFQQFHHRSKSAPLILKSLKRRPAQALKKEDSNKLLTADFLKLYQELDKEGLFDPSPSHIIYRISELIFLYFLGIFCISFGFVKIGIMALGLFQGRSGWLMHEMGHHSFTGNIKLDKNLQAFVYGIGDGMSSSWWSSQHNRHHAFPQRLKHDVDLDTLPFIAFNAKIVKNPKSQGQGFFIQNQAILFLLLDTFIVGLYWKLYLHPKYALKKKCYGQLLFMALHYFILPGQIGFFNYLISGYLASLYIFGNFSLSHTHLDVTDQPTHWVEFAFVHTANIKPTLFVTWWMSFLNFQIEHHLFPTMPQFKHPLIAERVKKLAKSHGLEYKTLSYFEALTKTFKNLWNVSNELKYTQ